MSMTSNVFFCRDAHTVRVRAITAEKICVPFPLTMEWKTIYTRFTYHQLCILYVFIFIYHNKYRFHFQFRMSFSTKTIIQRDDVWAKSIARVQDHAIIYFVPNLRGCR